MTDEPVATARLVRKKIQNNEFDTPEEALEWVLLLLECDHCNPCLIHQIHYGDGHNYPFDSCWRCEE